MSAGEPDGAFEELLAYLKRNRGFDFTGYKRAGLERRVRKRMAAVGIEGFRDYQDRLEVDPGEFTALFDTILINVTAFMRDKPAWDYLAQTALPALLEDLDESEPIRLWSAGCASGEEAYTASMLLCEALGEGEFKRRVKIYATDVDEDALQSARQATYPAEALEALPPAWAERYFDATPAGHTFRADLRRQVIFGRNDLVQDAPISRIDLLISRNTLMYFTAEAQEHILRHFNFALTPRGLLFLGRAEMLITHADLFTPEDLKCRVFRKVALGGARDRMSFVADGHAAASADERALLAAAALDASPLAQILVDSIGFLAAANRRAQALFSLGPADLGRPLQDLEVSYRPVDLRSAITAARENDGPKRLPRALWVSPEGERLLDVEVTPLRMSDGTHAGVMASFADVTLLADLDARHEAAKRELETAYEELQSTVEELETTNEELHSTNEELETTNEELQSTNEELETMNAELQSTNDELESLGEAQILRSGEVDRLNAFLEGLLGTLSVGVAVLDDDARVQVWNAGARDLWGVAEDEAVGRPLNALDIGLPVAELTGALDGALAGQTATEVVDAVTRRGRRISCWVQFAPLRSAEGANYGAIMLMVDRAAAPLGGSDGG